MARVKTFAVYVDKANPNYLEEAVFIKEGFSFFAAIFPFIWALYHRMWVYSLIFFVIFISPVLFQVLGYLPEDIRAIMQLGIGVLIGIGASDWHGASLRKKGYQLIAVTLAESALKAKQRFYDDWHHHSHQEQVVAHLFQA